MEFKRSKKKQVRRPLADVQAQQATKPAHLTKSAPEHSTPLQVGSSHTSSLREKGRQTQDLFGFDDILSPDPCTELSITPIYDGNPGTPTSVVSTNTVDTDSCVGSPGQGGKCAEYPRSYLVKSAFKREDPLRKRSPKKRVRRRLLEQKEKNDENDVIVDEHLEKLRDHFAEVAKFKLHYDDHT
ncbi:uncharacterized protein LOC134179435 [Corticium candelabrum]|uniref:uncharacterized protein LOC134179435 n=1 Tax=Corticium candelabrum TaxID=121492 RepID=UPI002E2559CF|nr:uncharacterized protein LOC134179435 [Corticium candelabrum]